jgi:hypothetical protein
MPDPRPWPLSRLDYRIESGRVLLDDGRVYPATALEEELYALLVEAAGKLAAARKAHLHLVVAASNLAHDNPDCVLYADACSCENVATVAAGLAAIAPEGGA